MIARAPEFTARAAEQRRPTPVRGARSDTMGDLRISESDIDVPDFLK